jgi:hypothetical protein
VKFFSCGFVFCDFLELSAADDEQLKNKQFLSKSQNISKLISNQRKSQENPTQALNFLNPLSIKQ